MFDPLTIHHFVNKDSIDSTVLLFGLSIKVTLKMFVHCEDIVCTRLCLLQKIPTNHYWREEKMVYGRRFIHFSLMLFFSIIIRIKTILRDNSKQRQ